MKKKDFTLIFFVVLISATLSFALSAVIFGDPEANPVEVERTEVLNDDFILPDQAHFNDDSINPTQLIRIGGEESNESPFGRRD